MSFSVKIKTRRRTLSKTERGPPSDAGRHECLDRFQLGELSPGPGKRWWITCALSRRRALDTMADARDKSDPNACKRVDCSHKAWALWPEEGTGGVKKDGEFASKM